MKTYLECIPCFFKQALEAAKLSGVDKNIQKEIMDEVSRLMPTFSLSASPPEMAKEIHALVREISDAKDPYKQIKKNSNLLALKIYPKLKQEIKTSEDRLLTAVYFSIMGNIIDYGAKNSFNVRREIDQLFKGNYSFVNLHRSAHFNYHQFREALNEVEEIVYLADNAGEVVFDRLLIEELVENNHKKVIYVVKEHPIINDALAEDAFFCGMNDIATIISNGTAAPGTLLDYCSEEFTELYGKAKLIISKGQANYETLSEENKSLFFLLRAKCPVIAKDIDCGIGDMVLLAKRTRLMA